ncbi:type III-A CRISPR-associated RAMP protein Csm3 [Taurinivorans muris]|uniref:CRISPR system Cms endoribonuclease Csm3 n=1 Tax=Taurinivorans muris TaxID=2787751 RepID=A0ABY5Y3L7_9BACT|nr:type III-A CRISPR-associated RAMP protein Csm3 [Desulfovibrionaceae bacterium LT0009]
MKLNTIVTLKGVICLKTGLHIGAGKDNIEIGGLDLPIMKNPRTKAPYIPGSSIKGKMRSMLEVTGLAGIEGTKPIVSIKGEPCGCGECLVCDLFGTHAAATELQNKKPTRLLVRDAVLTEDFQKKFENDELPMEIKYENIINRISGTAEHPRPVERVPAGVKFEFELAIKVFEGDNEEKFKEVVSKGLKLIELDGLGGHTSRGSGQVKFENLTFNGETFNLDHVTF